MKFQKRSSLIDGQALMQLRAILRVVRKGDLAKLQKIAKITFWEKG